MASIWKELLFLHGHFVRPEDLAEPAAPAENTAPCESRPQTPSRTAGTLTPELAGGCA